MKSAYVRKTWLSALVALVVGVAFLLAWELTHPGLPKGALVVPRDAATLSEALERVSPGGTVILEADEGPFAGPVVIGVPGVTVRSAGRRAVLRGGEGPAIEVVADGVTVERLVIRDGAVGVAVLGTGCRVRDVSIMSCDVGLRFLQGEGSVAQGVRIAGGRIGVEITSSGQTLRDVDCLAVSDVGVHLRNAVRVDVDGLTVDGAETGALLEQCVEARLTRLSIARCSRVGIMVVAGRDNSLSASSVRGAAVGIDLQEAQGAFVHACRVSGCADVGIRVGDSRGCRVSSAGVRSCRTGILLVGGEDHAIVDGCFADCGDTSIRLESSRNALIARNVISASSNAISADGSEDVQVLRNTVADASTCGVLLRAAVRSVVLDNVIRGGGAGIIAVSSDESLLQRNDVRGSRSVGLAVAGSRSGNTVTENRVRGHPVGVLITASSRDVFSQNDVLECQTGILLHRVGDGVRVRGNHIIENDVGLSWSDAAVVQALVDKLELRVNPAASGGAPAVSGNDFRANRTYDLEASPGLLLFAGGNAFHGRHGAREACTSGDVLLPPAAWRETVVLGAGASRASRVLGQLLAMFLSSRGFRVIDMAGLASEGALLEALARADVDAAWCFGDPDPHASWEIQARTGWALVASHQVADALGGDSRRTALPLAVSVVASPGVALDSVRGALEHLGLAAAEFRTAATAEAAEMALQLGEADVAVVDRLDETLTLAGFELLEDGGALPSAPIRLALSRESGEELSQALAELAPRITAEALRELVSRVRLLHRDPSELALDFLLREGLLED